MAQQEYEVEKIMNCGYSDGKLYYYVKWAGYDDLSDMTWEPYKNLENCQDIIEQYFRSQNIPKPPDIDPKVEIKKKSKKTDKAQTSKSNEENKQENDQKITTSDKTKKTKDQLKSRTTSKVIIDDDTFYKGKYAFVRVPKKPIITDGVFNMADPVDYGYHVRTEEINIERIARKEGKMFVVLNKKNKLEYVPFETAVMLFPDPLYEFMKSQK